MLNELNSSLDLIIQQTLANRQILAIVIGIPWLVYLIDVLMKHRLLALGIIPRKLCGLPGIFFAPFLHGDFNHLFFNTLPLLVLSDFILIQGVNYFLTVTILIGLISGFLIWLLGKPGIHIGASAIITGYWAFLVSSIYQEATPIAIILGLLSLYYFAGIFFGIFPTRKGVSWEGHLLGLFAGIVTTLLLRHPLFY
ncbi:MAG: rhomboid family intramembrane serine protease [Legionella sp.]|nr:rhomboid family intramembrane serine protease [Legionella sp.]